MQTQTSISQPARHRSAAALARAVVRDLREQDGITAADGTPTGQIRSWRRDASEAGDRVIVDAIDLLGVAEAAKIYGLPGRSSYLNAAERARLARATSRARC